MVGRGNKPNELGFVPQPMVRWLGPRGLSVTAAQVLLSGIFGAYSDKREIQAALKEPSTTDISQREGLWFDFLADTGDGFNATYATARLLAQEKLKLVHNGAVHQTQQGQLLILGGDLAYPAASAREYHHRFIGPYEAAFPAPTNDRDRPTMLALAGNHDWYDGLTTFLRLFCVGRAVGGWRTEQTRSYFAAHLPHDWWVMGVDLAFDFFIDDPQLAFFRQIATERMRPGDKVILVTHKPSWLFEGLGDHDVYTPMAMTNLQRFEREIIHSNGLRLPLVLGADIHHYNRYERPDGSQQRFTCGSGGTFLYPTHHLAKRIRWPEATGPAVYEQRRVYPDASTSKRLRWGTLLAPFKNPSFIVFIGLLYLLFAQTLRFDLAQDPAVGFQQALRDTSQAETAQALFNNPASFLLTIVLAGALIAFADAHTLRSRITVGLAHWLAHLLLIVAVLWGAAQLLVDWDLSVAIEIGSIDFRLTAFTVLFVLTVVVVGGYLGSQLFALYLFVMHTTRRKHPTHAFSCQRLEDYRSFLRIKVERDGALTIYPVGVRRVPRKWRLAHDRASHEPAFEPIDRPIKAELIEAPIRIDPDTLRARDP
jgi:Calcineurin-like phosphoesterase